MVIHAHGPTKAIVVSRIVAPPGWPVPEQLAADIKQEWQQHPDRTTATDSEALAYLSVSSSIGPLTEQAAKIYIHLFQKYTAKKGISTANLDFVNEHKTLSGYDQHELDRLKEHIFKAQQRDIAARRKALK